MSNYLLGWITNRIILRPKQNINYMYIILKFFLGFQFILALKKVDAVMMFKAIIALFTFLSQLFAYSVVGEYLKNQTEEIAFSIYDSNWHCLPAKYMRNILFMIARSQRPITFMAGGYLIVSLETYMSIIKTSFSYLSVLRMMIETWSKNNCYIWWKINIYEHFGTYFWPSSV